MKQLEGRTLFFPEMDFGGASILAASFRAEGISAQIVPPSTPLSLSLAGACTSGDECYPTKVTLGNFLEILNSGKYSRDEVAFFMATADGPCRFGQYYDFMRKTLNDLGYNDVPLYSLSSRHAYAGLGAGFERRTWRGIVAADILRKLLHMARPYEKNAGDADKVYKKFVAEASRVIADKDAKHIKELQQVLREASAEFDKIPSFEKGKRPLIGVVGEIFCRLNTFSNEEVVRKLEEHGAEAWMVGVAEWILYTNLDEIRRLTERRKFFTKQMLRAKIKRLILKHDEHALLSAVPHVAKTRPEAPTEDLVKLSLKYLPWFGSLGEMTLSAASSVYYHSRGCSGIVDVSSFACMNEIVAEAVFPSISKDLGGFPIKVFYFEGTSQNLDRDVDIFLELARNYKAHQLN